MACVILIHVSDKNEKMEILDSFSDNLNYEVITDLKKYVAKRYKVRIVEEEEDGGGDLTQMAAVGSVENKNIPLLATMVQNDQMNATVGNALTNRNTIEREEDGYGTFIPYRDRMVEPKKEKDDTVEVLVGKDGVQERIDNETVINPISIPSELVQGEVIDNVPHIDDIGVDVPCLNNLVEIDGDGETGTATMDNGSDVTPTNEAQETSINDESSTSTKRRSERKTKRQRYLTDDTESEGENSQKSIAKPSQQASKKKKSADASPDRSDAVPVVDSSNTPSTSTKRSGRSAKRPKYATDDEESDGESDCPVSNKRNSTLKQPSNKKKCGDRSVKTGIECKKCVKQLNAEYRWYSNAKDHAISHTDLKRYECSVKECTYLHGSYKIMRRHMNLVHKVNSFKPKKIDLTTEQEEELNQVTKECFPGFGDEYKVCKVCQITIANNSLDQYYLKRHSLHHIDFMLYKCNQQKCRYESKEFRNMTKHLRSKHGIEEISKEETVIELTDDQKKEINDMLKKCFPDEDDIDE